MKKMIVVKLVEACFAAALFAGLSSAAQATSTWTDTACGGPTSPSTSQNGDTASCASNGVTATLSAWATSGGTASKQGTGAFAAADLVNYGSGGVYGYGITSNGQSTSSPYHAIDNSNGDTEAVLVHFSTAVSLSQITLGWAYGNSDVTIMAYNGTSTSPLAGDTAANLASTSSGWTLVGSYANVDDYSGDTSTSNDGSDGTVNVNAADVTSSWWLISAYNSTYGGTTDDDSNSGASLSASVDDDYFKLLSFAANSVTTTNKTPEPGSIALAGVALLGVIGARRRKSSKAAETVKTVPTTAA